MNQMSTEARNFGWLMRSFAEATLGVVEAVAVSSDGLLLASSNDAQIDRGEQFAAIASGLNSLTIGAATCFEMDHVEQVIVEMSRGFLFIMAISNGSVLGVLAEKGCDVGLIGYEMTLLVERAGKVLTPELIAELQNTVSV